MEDLVRVICLYRDGERLPLTERGTPDRLAIDCIEIEGLGVWSARTVEDNRPVRIRFNLGSRTITVLIRPPNGAPNDSPSELRCNKRVPDEFFRDSSHPLTFSKICEICGLDNE